ncbi:hypothetical protein SCB71_06530 [Herbiconiux sp. KACC 21604]|uniref:hypothetical protein n=1 Tax=unclassified Herbiconiux TaxID=2618217 RepID=UPI001490CD34|nr:hypothetical protein [Herbiconiux sp. SALV-R1]QJU52968.1 hypothetical protein HL652_04510 [Herbiconiux sp. SALV-R1]WPO87895.1 hypothetical protein SCB71_06530 [Herbiconiux sp. KACC 21604]
MNASSITTGRPALRRVREGYWRVTAASGHVLGYVELRDGEHGQPGEPVGRRFTAKRLLPSLVVVPIGEFASAEEAMECLR